jgi:hypothetical protein
MSIKAGRPVAAGALDNRRSIPRTMVTTFRHHFAELPGGAKRRSIIPALCSGATGPGWGGSAKPLQKPHWMRFAMAMRSIRWLTRSAVPRWKPIALHRNSSPGFTVYLQATGRRIAGWQSGGDQCCFLASRKRSHRSTSSRRSAPWNGSTHPGYSGGRALTSSNCRSSSWVSVSSIAARLS